MKQQDVKNQYAKNHCVKRQCSNIRRVLPGLFCVMLLAVLAAAFFQINFAQREPKVQPARTVSVPPLPGHWLKTAREAWYSSQRQEIPKAEFAVKSGAAEPAATPNYNLESAGSALNRGLDSINVMYVWSDGDRLRVISVTSFNILTRQAAIVVIPLDTVVNTETTVPLQDNWLTLQDIYREQGREGVRDLLQEKLEIKIPNYVHVNQTALQKLSDIIGVLTVNGDETTMLEAFEETAAGIRTDDREVVRAVASRVLRPQMLLAVPELLWIFTHDITTNFSPEQMVRIFNISRQMDLGHMRKATLPGYEYFNDSLRYLLVSEQTWKNIMYEITN